MLIISDNQRKYIRRKFIRKRKFSPICDSLKMVFFPLFFRKWSRHWAEVYLFINTRAKEKFLADYSCKNSGTDGLTMPYARVVKTLFLKYWKYFRFQVDILRNVHWIFSFSLFRWNFHRQAIHLWSELCMHGFIMSCNAWRVSLLMMRNRLEKETTEQHRTQLRVSAYGNVHK